ncbi:MAG: 2-C-methyl-D-erythritol 2,4-cyclodiphosphate synthase [Candidatus Omnitrophica bacterium]|nr:2-C-methyl-D-erythritol 2,4-cyclodiphosphate synthase [Candidatus Omnitrophota bacterium]
MRMGIGFDVHEFSENRRLILGGIEIPYAKGLGGHSDADVLSHAICDALLGASGEGDMGEHFPDSDIAYKDVSSLELLKRTLELVSKKGFQIENVDTIIIAEEPKLSPFKESIRRKLAETLHLSETQVNVKAKTSEGLGYLGRSEGIASYAIVSMTSKDASK